MPEDRADADSSARRDETSQQRLSEPQTGEPTAAGSTGSGEAGQSTEQNTSATAEETPSGQQQLQPTDVYDVLRFTLGLLIEQAWIHLGIRLAPGAAETRTDLPKARVAIDAAMAVYEHLKPAVSEDDRKEIELALTNLRLNFARKA
ncbi:MAG: DUF1844 domain-containing protein [Armatimonadetes bacterium]|nr:DUF1844 domain-containing protein [Armatimonadota bacterium]